MLITSSLFTVGTYRKAIKFEESEKDVAWSDQEHDKDDGSNAVDISQDSRDVLADSDGQNPSGDTLSVNFNDLGVRQLTVVFQIC